MFDHLATLDPAALDAAGLVEAIVETERMAAWAMARQTELIAALHQDAVMEPECGDPRTTLDRKAMLEAELAPALHIARSTASTRIEVALALVGRLPGTLAALRAGRLDWYRASIIAEDTAEPAIHAAHQILEAGGSPAAAARAAAAVSRALEEAVLPRGCGQTAGGLRRSLGRAVIAADPDAAARRHETAVRERRASFVPQPDAMCELVFRLPAPDGVDVWNRLDHHARTTHAAGDTRTLDQLRVDALVDVVSRAPEGATRRSKAHVLVTVAADTLLGLDEEPAELDGYGPIPAPLARRIAAQSDATWRRLLTDPVSGVLLDYGRTTYTPPTALADFVIARDQTCTFPGCTVSAHRADLDHRIPYPTGPTSAENLHALCRRHHLLKHRGRWRITVDPDTGERIWISPTGRRHRREPEG